MRQYNIEDGLPSTEVHDLYQDADGYLWLATDHGLCRYDGTQFKVYTNADGLTDNTIFDIVPDADGRLWFTTYEGGICYLENERFYPHPQNDSLLQILGRYYVDNLIVDSSGHMLLSVSFSNAFQEPMLQIDTSGRIFREPELLRLPFRKSRFNSVGMQATLHEYLRRILQGKMVPEPGRTFISLSNGHYLVAMGPRLFEMDETGSYFVDVLYPGTVLTLLEDSEGAIWVGLDAGAGCYYYPEGRLHHHGKEVLPGRSISDILLDREGNYWFSTIEAGVFFMATNALYIPEHKDGYLPQKAVDLHVWLDKLWVGTYEGDLYTLNKEGVIERVFLNVGPVYDMANFRDSLLVTTARDIFLSDYTLLRDTLTGTISLRCFEWVEDGRLAMGGMRGFRLVSMEGLYTADGEMVGDFKTTYAMKSDDRGRLWIGALSGLYYLEKEQLHSARHIDPLLETRVTDLELLGPDTLLIATKGEGVLILVDEKIHQLDKQAGLSSNFIRDIYIEDEKTWWVSSNNGLNRLIFSADRQSCNIETFTVKSGLPSNEVNEVIEYEGKLWLATSRGACYLDPLKLSINRIAPQILITQVRINGEAIPERHRLELGPRENDIAINFKGLSFRNSTDVKYRYRLQGYDEEWTETRQSLANYTNLPAGSYEFQLHAANADHVWTTEPLILDFSIRQHFTESLWFILGCLLLSVGLITALVSVYVRRQKARAALDRQIVESEQKALRAQINPHFVFNAMNSIQYFITENDKHNAGVFLSRFSKLMRRILDNSKKNWITLEEEISATRHYLGLEKLRFGGRFSYELQIESGVDPYETEIPSMITQPFLENAIWHGLMPKKEPGHLKVHFFKEAGSLICEITDDGIGREQAAAIRRNKRHDSTGIKNVTERIELLNKLYNTQMKVQINDLKAENGQALGTMVQINLGKLPQ